MSRAIILVTGGSRSGKSRFALEKAQEHAAPRLFVATAPRSGDEEMAERIARHRKDRGEGWETVEAEWELVPILSESTLHSVILVDCLTLWVSNLMMELETAATEDEIAVRSGELVKAARQGTGKVIFVTNEVGMGIVPQNALARRFRDLAGRCNQIIAAASDEVYCVMSGIPLKLR